MALFYGFSTYDRDQKTNVVTDIDLVKRDILNELYTRKGERVMFPSFGCIVWDMMYEPLVEANKNAIYEDVKRVVNRDTRVTLQDIEITEVDSGISMIIWLLYTPSNAVVTMELTFDRESIE